MRLFFIVAFCLGLANSLLSQTQTWKEDPLTRNDLIFTPNKGQIVDMNHQPRPDVLFKGSVAGGDVYVRKSGMSYVLNDWSQVSQKVTKEIAATGTSPRVVAPELRQQLLEKEKIRFHRIDIDFLNCSSHTEIISEEPVDGITNIYGESCMEGITNIRSSHRVMQKNIYKNIDIKYYGSSSQNNAFGLKYDIVVNPGGDVNNIQMKYSGAERLELRGGKLLITTSLGVLTESIPKVYQNINGKIVDVKTTYVLESTAKNESLIHFSCAAFNSSFPLVIDPWSTYYGGGADDWAWAINTNAAGDALFTGFTNSSNFPVSAGAFISTGGGGTKYDGVIVKLNSAGSKVFATYFTNGFPSGLDCDAGGNVIVTGYVVFGTLPTKNPGGGAYFQASSGGSSDAFIAKFSPLGALIWSTYYGGSISESGYDVVVDAANNIIVAGYSNSLNLPVTVGAYQPANAGTGNADAFVVKFNNLGVRQWATYFGGNQNEVSYSIACDASGDIFVCGVTTGSSPNTFPTSPGAFCPVYPSPIGCAFVFKLLGTTGFRVWATYYGGTSLDQAFSITTDTSGNVYVGGMASSNNGIASPGSYQPTQAGTGNNAFVVKFDNAGTRLWATYIGGSAGSSFCLGVDCDASNNIVLCGETGASDFPVTACSFQTVFAGVQNQFIAKFTPVGSLVCSGLIQYTPAQPGVISTSARNMAVNGCDIYVIASTNCNYPVSPGALQPTCGGGKVEFGVAKLNLNTCGGLTSATNTINFSGNPTTFCAAQAVNFTSIFNTGTSCDTTGATYSWIFKGASPGTSTVKNPTGINYSTPGAYDVKLIVQTSCSKDSVEKLAYINMGALSIQPSVLNDATCGSSNGSATVTVNSGSNPYTYSWSNNASGQTVNTLAPGIYSVTVTDASGCQNISSVTIKNGNGPTTLASVGSAILCNADSGSVNVSTSTGSGPFSYSWSTGASSITTGSSQTLKFAAGSYTVTITDASGCTSSSTVLLSQPSALNTSATKSDVCPGTKGSVTITTTGGTGNYTYNWSGGVTGNTSVQNNLAVGTYTTTITDANGCTITMISNVASSPKPTATASASPTDIVEGNSTTLSGSGGTTYLWTPSSSLSCSSCQSPTATPAATTTYTLFISDANGCKDTSDVTVTVRPLAKCEDGLYIPNAFSPNGDNNNDIIHIHANGIHSIKWAIFDRWGNKVFETTDLLEGWDGKYNGKVMDSGVYVYYFSGICQKLNSIVELKGNITLMQ